MATQSGMALRLSDLVTVSTVVLQLHARERNDVLLELVGKIPELAQQPDAQQTLYGALLEREQLHSTGIGEGIALPHARNALPGLLKKPVVVFGRHAEGIEYGSIDGAPARLFFLLVATTLSQHLHILARISRVLRVPQLRQDLLTAQKAEKVVALIREAEARLDS